MAVAEHVGLNRQASNATATNDRHLLREVRRLRELDDRKSVINLACEYATAIALIGATVWFMQHRESLALAWAWNIPVVGLAVVLIGGLQHRLAGLGHEAAHFTLFKNKFLNEVVADWFCMFPIFATTHQYRLVHMAHHQFTNDWERDPDLTTIGKSKLMHQFPMSRTRFVYNYFVRFFLPHVLLKYFLDVLYLSAMGSGKSPYLPANQKRRPPIATILGISHVLTLVFAMARINRVGGDLVLLIAVPAAWLALGLLAIALLPDGAFFQSPMKCVCAARTTAAMRLAYYTLLFSGFGWMRAATGVSYGVYFWLLWVLPLLTSFSYFMLLRDVYQHGNADTGKLTNTRVFHSDPFTNWAIWVYGMDMHVPHHLHPAVPHYNLPKLHRLLMEHSSQYAREVVECRGTFFNRTGEPTVLDVMQPH